MNNLISEKSRAERAIPFVLSAMVLLASLFFLIGGWVIPAIGSYY